MLKKESRLINLIFFADRNVHCRKKDFMTKKHTYENLTYHIAHSNQFPMSRKVPGIDQSPLTTCVQVLDTTFFKADDYSLKKYAYSSIFNTVAGSHTAKLTRIFCVHTPSHFLLTSKLYREHLH